MKTRMKFISSILMLLIIATTGVWAVDITDVKDKPESPTNDATAGLASSEADQFMNVLDWSQVKFDKVFTYMGFKQGTTTAHEIDLGAAFKAGPVYIGSWYQGDLGVLNVTRNKDVTTTLTKDEGTVANTNTVEETKLSKSHNAAHKFAALVGFGNIGINLGYNREGNNQYGKYFGGVLTNNDSVTTNTNSDYTDKTEYDPRGFNKAAKHTPFVGFGMNLNLGKLSLSPTASFAVEIDEKSEKGFKTTTKKGDGKYSIVKEATGNENKSDAKIGIMGSAGVLLGLGDSLNSTFELGYNFRVNAYNKTYKAADGTKHKFKGSYKITMDKHDDDYNYTAPLGYHVITTDFQADFTKKSYFKNTLNLGYTMQKDFERFSFLASFKAPITLSFETTAEETKNTQIKKTTHIDPSKSYDDNTYTKVITSPVKTTKTTTIRIDPELDLALSYAAVPNKLKLNIGTNVKFFGKGTDPESGYYTKIEKITHNTHVTTTVETTTYEDGRVHKETKVNNGVAKKGSLNKTSAYHQADVELKGGLCWNIVDNLNFDLVYTQSLLATDPIKWYELSKLKLALTVKF